LWKKAFMEKITRNYDRIYKMGVNVCNGSLKAEP
jgi:hypothetical protein